MIENTIVFELKKSDYRKSKPILEDLAGIHWVLKALVPFHQDRRPHVTHMHVKDKVCTGIDGTRLHQFTLSGFVDLPDGFYRVVKNMKTHIILIRSTIEYRYPKTDDILFASDSEKMDMTKMDLGKPEKVFADIIRELDPSHDNRCFNYDLLRDILSYCGNALIDVNSKAGMVRIFNGSRTAICMAMRG